MQEIRLKNEQVEREESSFELQQQAFNKRERQQVWLERFLFPVSPLFAETRTRRQAARDA